MQIKYNKVNNVWQGATWLKLGWQIFKQQPVTWAVMVLMFFIAGVVGSSFTIGHYIVALFAPVFTGGIFLAMAKSERGERVQIEDLFLAFKHSSTLKELLLIGLIGMALIVLNSLITLMPGSGYMMSVGSGSHNYDNYRPISLGALLIQLITWPWLLAVFFGIPLVAVRRQQALPALKSSLWVSFMHLIAIVPFSLMVALLTVVAILPVGLGLLVWAPVLFCSVFSAFSMIYSERTKAVNAANSAELVIGTAKVSAPSSKPETQAQQHRDSVLLTAKASSTHVVDDRVANVKQGLLQSVIEAKLPKHLQIGYYKDCICISRRWFSARAVLAVILSVLSIAGSYYIASGEFDSSNFSGEQWFIDLLPWLCALMALLSTYVFLAQCLNRTDIFVSTQAIEVKHSPLPWFGNKRLQVSKIKQLYVKEESRIVNERTGQTRRYYSVEIIPHTGSNYHLLRSLQSSQQAIFIEQEIEKYLNLEDQRVPGEFQ